jgi:hypothetical protein
MMKIIFNRIKKVTKINNIVIHMIIIKTHMKMNYMKLAVNVLIKLKNLNLSKITNVSTQFVINA